MAERYALIASADVGRMGEQDYLFDRTATGANVLYLPTQGVSAPLARVVTTIKAAGPAGSARTLEQWQSLFTSEPDRRRVQNLVASGYLEAVGAADAADGAAGAVEAEAARVSGGPGADAPNGSAALAAGDQAQTAPSPFGPSRSLSPEMQVAHFRRNVIKHYLKKPVFFNLPAEVDSATADVGLVGVPVSSVPLSGGTTFGPDRLRQYSQTTGFWFDYCTHGVYSEVGCDDSQPSVLCRDVVLKDFGNLGAESRTVGHLFAEAHRFVDEEILPHGIRPVFVGGDHAITFPIVDAFLRHHPSLVLLHLDAHNDLFYCDRVEFNHAGPVHGLLLQSGLESVYSFGLRTHADDRVGPYQQLANATLNNKSLDERVHLHSIGATLRRLRDPAGFQEYLVNAIGADTPVYLTVDLDVLSGHEMGDQLSTPAGTGFDFHSLYEFVGLATAGLNVIAADVVEFSVSGDASDTHVRRDTVALLTHLIHGLHLSAKRQSQPLSGTQSSDSESSDAESVERSASSSAGAASASGSAATHTSASDAAPSAAQPSASGTTQTPAPPTHQAHTAKSAHSATATLGGTGTTQGLPTLSPGSMVAARELRTVELPRRSLRDLDYDTFLTEHVLPGIPVVLTDCFDGKAVADWSLEYFLARVERSADVGVRVFPELYDHERSRMARAPVWDTLALMRERDRFSLAEADPRYYIVDWAFGEQHAALYDDIPVPAFFSTDISRLVTKNAHALKWIYFGEAGTGSPTHVDVLNSCAWLLLATGTKAWRMVHRDDAAKCRQRGRWVDLFNPDWTSYPELHDVTVYDAVQRPGEIVWTPPLCVHAVRNLELSIAVTQNYVDLTNLADVMDTLIDHRSSRPDDHQPDLSELLEAAVSSHQDHGYEKHVPALLAPIVAQLQARLSMIAPVHQSLQDAIGLSQRL